MLRRDSLKILTGGAALFVSGLLKPIIALAKWNDEAFRAEELQVAMDAYFPGQEIIESDKIKISVHPVVENGAVVPIKINTDLPKPESISIFVEKNPNPLIANFDLFPGCRGFVSTRIKVQQPSDIIVTVKSEDSVYMTKTSVEVQEGGCG